MPDQNSAASEHAIMQEITQPLADLPHDPVSAVASAEFPLALRGYDREAVDEYVRRTTQLVAELSATRSPDAAVRRALERVGEQVSSILARAHETAAGITSQSRAEAEERLMTAHAEAEELERDARTVADQLELEAEQKAQERERAAELRVQELDADVDRIWAERDRIVSDVRKLSEELSELAGVAATRFPAATTDEAAVVASPGHAMDASAQSESEASTLGEPELAAGSDSEVARSEPGDPEVSAGAEPEMADSEVPAAAEPDVAEDAGTEMADDAGPPVVLGESPTPDGADAEVLPEDEAALRETEVPFEDEAALRENEVPFEDEAALREIPADLRDDQFPTFEHEVRVSDLQSGRATTEPDRATAEPFAAPGPGLGVAGAAEHPTSVLQVPRMRVIDLLHLGNERVIGCWQVDDILIDPGPASCLEVLLGALEDRPRALLLTHIHLDHAGATGSLVKRWPDLEVYVHEQGAPHLAHPARLLESAQRLYGDDMERLWGEFLPVPEANLHVLSGGEKLFNGRFEVAYTPGHASHHVSYRHEQTAFVGDVAGVRITPETLTVPPTPPPDIDIEGWHASIDQLLRWKPERLAMTHFGANDDIGGQLADLADRLDTWAALVHTEDLQTFVGIVEGEIERGASAAHRVAYKQAAPPEQIYAGLERYWRKREGGAGSSEGVTRRPLAGDDVTEGPRGSAAEPSTHAGRSARASRWAPRSG